MDQHLDEVRAFIGELLDEALLHGEGLGRSGDDLLQLRFDEVGQFRGWDRTGDDPGGGRLGAGHEVSGDDEVHRPVVADPVEEHMVGTGIEHRTDRGERGPELRVLGGDDDVGGRGHSVPEPECRPLDLRDHGDRQRPDRLEDGGEDLGEEGVGIVGLDVDVRDVTAGAEDLALTADDERADVRDRLGDLGHGGGDIAQVVRVEGVAGLGSVEDDLGDRAAVLQLDLGHGCSFACPCCGDVTRCRNPARTCGRVRRRRPCPSVSAGV